MGEPASAQKLLTRRHRTWTADRAPGEIAIEILGPLPEWVRRWPSNRRCPYLRQQAVDQCVRQNYDHFRPNSIL